MTNQKTPVQGGATKEQIEAAAEVLADNVYLDSVNDSKNIWDHCSHREKQDWRSVAKRALEAALSASASADPADEHHDAEAREAAPPEYLALDVWQALGLPVGEFDAYYERNGCADTWANLLHAPGGVSRRPICGAVVDGEACVLRGHSHGPHLVAGDVGTSEPLPGAESDDHAATVTGDREKLALDHVWKAMGCAWNPDAFKTGVRDTMWSQVVQFCEEQTAGNNRLHRENEELRAALAAPVAVDEELVAEARTWVREQLPPSPWADSHIVHRLIAAVRGEG